MPNELTTRAKKLLARGGPVGAIARLSAVTNPTSAVFDIGVNRGTIGRHLIRIFPEAPAYFVEPLPQQVAYLRDRFSEFSNLTVVEQAFSDIPGIAEFYVGDAVGTSSLLAPLPDSQASLHAENRVADMISVNVNTLDQFCSDAGIDHISCMKIDAQGSEDKIFLGASDMLANHKIDIIMFEWFAVPHYENSPLLLDLWNRLSSFGYDMFDIFPGRKFQNGQRRFGDAVFVSDTFRRDAISQL